MNMYYADRPSKEEPTFFFNKTTLKYWIYDRGERSKFKIHVLFYGGTAALRQMKFGEVKGHEHNYNFYFDRYFLWNI
jgi:hypothetical protein